MLDITNIATSHAPEAPPPRPPPPEAPPEAPPRGPTRLNRARGALPPMRLETTDMCVVEAPTRAMLRCAFLAALRGVVDLEQAIIPVPVSSRELGRVIAAACAAPTDWRTGAAASEIQAYDTACERLGLDVAAPPPA